MRTAAAAHLFRKDVIGSFNQTPHWKS